MPASSFLGVLLVLAPTSAEPSPPSPVLDRLPGAELGDDYEPPFPSEEYLLSQVLQEASSTNYDLALYSIDQEIREAQILVALGAYDVYLLAGLNGTISETPQRGSQFVFSLATRTLSGELGFRRALETGGLLTFTVAASRTLTDQPINPFDADSGSTTLSQYTVRPTLQLTHPLLQGLGLKVNRAAIRQAEIARSQAEAQTQITAQNLASDLIAAYWNVLFAHRDLVNKRRSVILAQRQLERTEALVAAGRLSPVDAKAVEQSLAVRESDVITAENALLDASLNLRTLMGQQVAHRPVLGVVPTTDPVVVPGRFDLQAEIERALATNPQIRQLEMGLASLAIDELVAANRKLPQLDFQATFTPQGRSVDTVANASTGESGDQGNWPEAFRNIFSDDVAQDGLLADWTLTGGLTLTWDIQNRGPKAQHQIAKLQLDRAEAQLQQLEQQISASVIRSVNNLRTSAKLMDVAEISVDLAEDNLEAEQARFDVGRSTNFDVLMRLDELDAAAANALQSRISYLQSLAQLQALTGEILPAYGLSAGDRQ